MNIFQVPRREVHVRIRLSNGSEVEGTFFVPEVGPDGGPGRLIDRLNNDAERFLPLVSGELRLVVAKTALRVIEVTGGDEEPPEAASDCVVNVRVSLEDGASMEGRIHYFSPPERRRILDFLNEPPSFISVSGPGRGTYVRKDAIVSVEELDSPD